MITLEQATTAQTEAEIEQALLADMASNGVDAAGFSPFAVARVMPALDARALAYEQQLRVRLAGAAFLDLAAKYGDEWVDRIVGAWFTTTRVAATKTRWMFRLTAALGAGTITAGARELVADAGRGVYFDNMTSISIPAGTSALVEFECRTAGIAGNVLAGAVTGFQIGKSGLSVTNPAGGITYAGRDKERNVDYIARGRAKFASNSVGGARAAYLVWIVEAFEKASLPVSVTKVGVDDANPSGPGSTDIYLANATGPATVDELAVVDAYLQPRRGLGTGRLRVLAAPLLTIPVVATLYVDSNADAVADSQAALNALKADFPLGGAPHGYLFTDAIKGALLGPDGVRGVYKVDLITPGADVPLSSPYQTITFTYGLSLA